AVIDVVRAKAGPHQLLEQVGFLVAALRRSEAGERRRTVRVAEADQAPAGEIERFLPRGLAELVAPVGGNPPEARLLRGAGLAHQRDPQALATGRVVEAEAPLDAQPAAIGRSVAAFDVLDPVARHVVGHLAADAAERAQR